MSKIKSFVWKMRFTLSMCKRGAVPILNAWEMAGANLENLSGDTAYSPLDAVQDEFDAWAE